MNLCNVKQYTHKCRESRAKRRIDPGQPSKLLHQWATVFDHNVFGVIRRWSCVIIAGAAVSLASCNYHETKTPQGTRGSSDLSGPADFETLMSDLFGPSCIACHNSGRSAGGVNLETFETITKGKGRSGPLVVPGNPDGSLVVSVITSGRMPKGGGTISPQLVDLLKSWIKNGATLETRSGKGTIPKNPGQNSSSPLPNPTPNPSGNGTEDCKREHHLVDGQQDGIDDDHGGDDDDHNPCQNKPPVIPTPPSTPTTFADVSQALFQPYCKKCHIGDDVEANVNLGSRESIINRNPAIVVAGNLSASRIWEMVSTGQMPPRNNLRPSPEAIEKLKNWILTPGVP